MRSDIKAASGGLVECRGALAGEERNLRGTSCAVMVRSVDVKLVDFADVSDFSEDLGVRDVGRQVLHPEAAVLVLCNGSRAVPHEPTVSEIIVRNRRRE